MITIGDVIIKKLTIHIISLTVCLILTFIGSFSNIKILTAIGAVSSAVLGSVISIILESVSAQNQTVKLWWDHIKYYNKNIRLSFSYLYRVQVDGKYLLVKGNRLKNQYQPIGGVYKYYNEAKPFLESINYIPDTRMKNNEETDDLRIQIKGKYLLEFMQWFLSMKNREYDPSREFKEELLTTKLLPANSFKILHYRKIAFHNKGLTYSKYNNCIEFLYADIFELTLTEDQKQIIRESVKKHPKSLCLADSDELKSMCHNGIEKNLGNNAKWLIGEYDE